MGRFLMAKNNWKDVWRILIEENKKNHYLYNIEKFNQFLNDQEEANN
jgi:hypothetical protein